jgi:hypothetical protein
MTRPSVRSPVGGPRSEALVPALVVEAPDVLAEARLDVAKRAESARRCRRAAADG